MDFNCIVVLGPTASGKTRLACQLAFALEGEIISADSRQVYRRLDLGTGKDLNEYVIHGTQIPYHLMDIAEPSEQFYLHQYTAALKTAFKQIHERKKLPIICGGTGLYLDALRKDFSFTQIAEDPLLRKELEALPKQELISKLKNYPEQFTNHVDLNSKKRIIRGIEVAGYFSRNGTVLNKVELPYKPYYLGIRTEAEQRNKNISARLLKRLDEGLIEEVEDLLKSGVTHERLELFGLEYKFISRFLKGMLSKEQLAAQLSKAICQFAKRQMTWFRKMEKEGVIIHWIEKDIDLNILSMELKEKLTL